MSFFDSWLAFNTCFDSGNFSALTQLVGYKLLAVDNEQQHPESFLLADRELMNRTNIKSGQTIVEARRQLKNAGLIDFTAGKGTRPTRYSIKRESSTNQALIKHKTSTNQAQGFISYSLEHEEEEIKKKEKKEGAYAREVAGATGTPAQEKTLSLPDFDENEIQEVWFRQTGWELKGDCALELEMLASKDFALTEAAIKRAYVTKKTYVLQYDHFKDTYNSLKNSGEKTPERKARSRAEEIETRMRELEAYERKLTQK